MQRSGPTVMFVSHEATRTGAPICLLHLVRWITQHTNILPIVLLRRGGELTKEFQTLAPTFCWSEKWVFFGWRRVLPHLRLRRFLYPLFGMRLRSYLQSQNIHVIYSNTATNAELSDLFAQLGCPVITHVHELEYAIGEMLRPDDIMRIKTHTAHYIACCHAVKDNLVRNLKVSANTIDVVHEFVPVPEHNPVSKREAQTRIRTLLNLPDEARIVLGAGTTDWRKGTDLFVQLAHNIIRDREMNNVHFVWIGGQRDETEFRRVRYDVHKVDLEGRIHLPGTVTNPADFFAAADVFVLTSREDPFPLVMLEAAVFRVPTVCFASAGGAPEFVEHDAGIVVPYLALDAMTDAVQVLLSDGIRRLQLGTRAAEKVRERHDVAVGAPQIFSIIEQLCAARAS